MESTFGQDSESLVLVIYTGGTIGMLSSSRGYVTYPGYMHDHLRTQSRFHDPLNTAIQSGSISVDTYRTWASSPAHSGSQTPVRPDTPRQSNGEEAARLTLQAERTIEVVAEHGKKQVPTLVLPKTPQGRRVRYGILEYERLIDSSEITFADYLRMCETIKRNYTAFDAFVILHGTDTMAYSASALSFLLEHLGKTVILTGAQIPLSNLRNDAVENLLGALMLAGSYVIPEVCLYFNHTLFRGNRSNKRSSFDFDAFECPNMAPLAKVGISVDVRWDLVCRPTARKQFTVHDKMCDNVAVLRLFPGITPASIRAFLAHPIEGIVLESFGAGNAPQTPALLNAFREAAARGVVIVNVSQCAKGTVASEIYEAGRALAAAGVVGGRDMTTECALAKLAYLLAKPDLSREDVRSLIGRPLRGELTVPAASTQYAPTPPQDRLQSFVGQLSLLVRPSAQPPIIKIGALARSPSSFISDSMSSSGAETYDGVSADDLDAAEQVLLPVSIALAAAKDGDSLQILLGRAFDSAASSPMAERLRTPSISNLDVLNSRSPPFGLTPLHIAASLGIKSNVELLLDYGASVHVRDAQDHTSMYHAAVGGHEEVVEALKRVGGHLGAAEVANGEVGLRIQTARKAGSDAGLKAWRATDVDFDRASEALQQLLSPQS